MDADALARSIADTERALHHIAYGPIEPWDWMENARILVRDFRREWRGESTSVFSGRLMRAARYGVWRPSGFRAGPVMTAWVTVLVFVPDCVNRLRGYLDRRRHYYAACRSTQRMARRRA